MSCWLVIGEKSALKGPFMLLVMESSVQFLSKSIVVVTCEIDEWDTICCDRYEEYDDSSMFIW